MGEGFDEIGIGHPELAFEGFQLEAFVLVGFDVRPFGGFPGPRAYILGGWAKRISQFYELDCLTAEFFYLKVKKSSFQIKSYFVNK